MGGVWFSVSEHTCFILIIIVLFVFDPRLTFMRLFDIRILFSIFFPKKRGHRRKREGESFLLMVAAAKVGSQFTRFRVHTRVIAVEIEALGTEDACMASGAIHNGASCIADETKHVLDVNLNGPEVLPQT